MVSLGENNNSTRISKVRPKDTELVYYDVGKTKNFNELLTRVDNQEDSLNEMENDSTNRMNSYKLTSEISNIPHVNQDQLSSLYPSQYIQKRFTNINSSSRCGKIIGKDGALISRSKSMSAPEFIRRRRTLSEKEEENDKGSFYSAVHFLFRCASIS